MDIALFIPIVAIVVAVPGVLLTVRDITVRVLRFKEREAELLAANTAEKAAQYASHIERLESRIRVLERIATDKGANLADQIEDLRDDKLN